MGNRPQVPHDGAGVAPRPSTDLQNGCCSVLKDGSFKPLPVRRTWIPKGGSSGRRPLGIPAVKDRIVQGALRNVLEPIWEKDFVDQSYGFRPGRSCKDALRHMQGLLRSGHHWVVDADIANYFEEIDHDRLLREVEMKVSDGRVLALIRSFLRQKVLDGTDSWEPERGTPQGAVISPLLANIYLHPLDIHLIEAGLDHVRYADDLVILCRSEPEARRALSILEEGVAALGLRLHPEKTKIVDARDRGGFDFLGYHFERGYRYPRQKSEQKLKDKVRARTRRQSGRSLAAIIEDLNPILRGWFGYFQHSSRWSFKPVDQWIRMRLRTVLRRFNKGHGHGYGTSHWRWPNAYFKDQGLFILSDALDLAQLRSRCGNH